MPKNCYVKRYTVNMLKTPELLIGESWIPGGRGCQIMTRVALSLYHSNRLLTALVWREYESFPVRSPLTQGCCQKDEF